MAVRNDQKGKAFFDAKEYYAVSLRGITNTAKKLLR